MRSSANSESYFRASMKEFFGLRTTAHTMDTATSPSFAWLPPRCGVAKNAMPYVALAIVLYPLFSVASTRACQG